LSKARFLELHSEKLFDYEIKEIKELKDNIVYFCGETLERDSDYINQCKEIDE
jgi:hypothetical protein